MAGQRGGGGARQIFHAIEAYNGPMLRKYTENWAVLSCVVDLSIVDCILACYRPSIGTTLVSVCSRLFSRPCISVRVRCCLHSQSNIRKGKIVGKIQYIQILIILLYISILTILVKFVLLICIVNYSDSHGRCVGNIRPMTMMWSRTPSIFAGHSRCRGIL